MTSDETRIQIFANRPMSHAKRVTRDNKKNLDYHVVAAIRKLLTDTNCPAGKSWPNHVKNEHHIGSEKTYGPKNNLLLTDREVCTGQYWPEVVAVRTDRAQRMG